METFEVAKLDTGRVKTKLCPKCRKGGSGPYRRKDHPGFYFKHTVIEKGARRTVWHYVPARDSPSERREKLAWLVKRRGWCGMKYFAGLLGVSKHTIRRDLDALRKEGKIIHQPYGGYIADPSGTLLKEKPWIAWS